jgi:hypothetical protein
MTKDMNTFIKVVKTQRSRYSDWLLDDREVRVGVPVGPRIFTSLCRPDRPWGPPNLLCYGCRGVFLGGKADGA